MGRDTAAGRTGGGEAAQDEEPLSLAPSRTQLALGNGWREALGRDGAGWKAEPAWPAGQGSKAPPVLEVRGGSPSASWLELILGVREKSETSRTGGGE